MDNKDNNPHLGENTALPIDGWQKELDDLRNKELPQGRKRSIINKGYFFIWVYWHAICELSKIYKNKQI